MCAWWGSELDEELLDCSIKCFEWSKRLGKCHLNKVCLQIRGWHIECSLLCEHDAHYLVPHGKPRRVGWRNLTDMANIGENNRSFLLWFHTLLNICSTMQITVMNLRDCILQRICVPVRGDADGPKGSLKLTEHFQLSTTWLKAENISTHRIRFLW